MKLKPNDRTLSPAKRQQWILDYMKSGKDYCVDVCHSDFVDQYIDHTNAPFSPCMFGADRCRMLGYDLSQLYKAGKLSRWAAGLQGMGGMGFPRWVYSYSLPKG